jgi:hypothetical protein
VVEWVENESSAFGKVNVGSDGHAAKTNALVSAVSRDCFSELNVLVVGGEYCALGHNQGKCFELTAATVLCTRYLCSVRPLLQPTHRIIQSPKET